MMNIIRTNREFLYRQAANRLRNMIRSGVFPAVYDCLTLPLRPGKWVVIFMFIMKNTCFCTRFSGMFQDFGMVFLWRPW